MVADIAIGMWCLWCRALHSGPPCYMNSVRRPIQHGVWCLTLARWLRPHQIDRMSALMLHLVVSNCQDIISAHSNTNGLTACSARKLSRWPSRIHHENHVASCAIGSISNGRRQMVTQQEWKRNKRLYPTIRLDLISVESPVIFFCFHAFAFGVRFRCSAKRQRNTIRHLIFVKNICCCSGLCLCAGVRTHIYSIHTQTSIRNGRTDSVRWSPQRLCRRPEQIILWPHATPLRGRNEIVYFFLAWFRLFSAFYYNYRSSEFDETLSIGSLHTFSCMMCERACNARCLWRRQSYGLWQKYTNLIQRQRLVVSWGLVVDRTGSIKCGVIASKVLANSHWVWNIEVCDDFDLFISEVWSAQTEQIGCRSQCSFCFGGWPLRHFHLLNIQYTCDVT